MTSKNYILYSDFTLYKNSNDNKLKSFEKKLKANSLISILTICSSLLSLLITTINLIF